MRVRERCATVKEKKKKPEKEKDKTFDADDKKNSRHIDAENCPPC